MKALLDFIPLFVFYYLLKSTDPKNSSHPLLKYFGFAGAADGNDILVATAGLIISMVLVYGFIFIYQKFKFDKMQTFVLVLTVVMGGITLALRDPTYIKLKAIIINIAVAGAFLVSPYFSKDKTLLVERMLGPLLVMPRKNWVYLNYSWVGLYVFMALLHTLFAFVIANGKYWGEFSVFGDMLVMITFLVVQLIILRKYFKSVVAQQEGDVKPQS